MKAARLLALAVAGAVMLVLGVSAAWAGPPPTIDVQPMGSGSGQVDGTTFGGTDIFDPNCLWNGAARSGDCTETLASATVVNITATPLAGSIFVDWNGTCPDTTSPNDATCSFTVNPATPVTLTPRFDPDVAATVTAQPAGAGSGNLSATLPGPDLDCNWNGAATSGACVVDITAFPTIVAVTATPSMGSTFGGFTACPGTVSGTGGTVCTFTVDDPSDDVTVRASFLGPDTVANLVVEPQGTGQGTVTGTGPSGAVINCTWNGTSKSGDCDQAVGTGEGGTFTLTGTAASGSSLTSWTNCPGTVSPDGSQCTFTILDPSDDFTIRPVFTLGGGPPPPSGCTITGTPGDDTLTGTPGADTICGLGGNDVIRAGGGADTVLGGSGGDTINGGGGGDNVNGGPGADRIFGDQGSDSLSGGAGDDQMAGGGGPDSMSGGAGADRLLGNGGSDALSGGAGNDVLLGGTGPDALGGGPGRDFADGGPGIDRCSAERRVSC